MDPRSVGPAAFALLLAAFLAGCASGSDGTASVYVKDATTDSFREVHLVLTEVTIHQSSDGNSTAGWKTLYSGSADVNLLNATGAKAAFLGQGDVAAGKYQQMRLKATSAYGIDRSGNRVAISLPQGELKVVKGFRVEAGKETQLVLDVDLDRSLKQGQSGWEFKPVVGKLYAGVKEKSEKPAAGTIGSVDLKDDAT